MSTFRPTSTSDRTPHGTPTRLDVLVVGHRGMLGRDLGRQLSMHRISAEGLDLPEIDITDKERIATILDARQPRVVINCAAYTAVDKAESEPGPAFAVNRDGPANLADACRQRGTPLIHISTDYVFDGLATYPYREEDSANPLGVYGLSKWEGEEAVRSRLPEHMIVRTAWLFGAHGPNFVKTMLRLAKEREELKVVADQHGCPTWTMDLADALAKIALKTLDESTSVPWGTYHFCGEGQTTWHRFAEEIIHEGRRHEDLKTHRIVPITTADYPTPARRPAWSVLDCRKIERAFGVVPRSWRFGLEEVVREFYREK